MSQLVANSGAAFGTSFVNAYAACCTAVAAQAVSKHLTTMLHRTQLPSARKVLLCPCVALHRSCALPAKLRGLRCSSGRCRRRQLMPPVQMGRRSSKIAVRKGVQDAKKAKSWGKYGKLILQAAKAGGPSPEANARLGEVCLCLATRLHCAL